MCRILSNTCSKKIQHSSL